MSLWKCDYCGLRNYLNRICCQACFRTDKEFKRDIDCVDHISELIKYLDAITLVNLYLSSIFDTLSYNFMVELVKSSNNFSIIKDLEYEPIISKCGIKEVNISNFSNAVDIKRYTVEYFIYPSRSLPSGLNFNYSNFNEYHDFERCGSLDFKEANYFPISSMHWQGFYISDDDFKLLLQKIFHGDKWPLNDLKVYNLCFIYDPWEGQVHNYDYTFFHWMYFIRNDDFSHYITLARSFY